MAKVRKQDNEEEVKTSKQKRSTKAKKVTKEAVEPENEVQESTEVVDTDSKDTESKNEVQENIEVVDTEGIETDVKDAFDEQFKAMEKDGVKGIVIKQIKHYVDEVYGKNNSPKAIVAQNFNFYNIINSILNETDYQVFKNKFDVINKVFSVETDGKFNPVSLSRFDHLWSYGNDSRTRYTIIIEYINAMATPAGRQKAKLKYPINSLAKHISGTAIQNLSRYYNL